MKHIRLFENWQDKIEKDLAFPSGQKFKDEDEYRAYAYRFRKLVADRDITSSLDKIKAMHRDGTLNRALDGYKVTDLKKSQNWSRNSKFGGDDVVYSLRRYV